MFAYVILHYRTLEVTKQCVEKLLKLFPESKIVVVDNFSNDGSFEVLSTLYNSFENFHIIQNNQNLGFAKGNNSGYSFVKSNYDADFVVVMNNDVFINDENFESRISDFYSQHHFAVIGPDILTPENKHQNPLLKESFSSFRLFKQVVIDSFRLMFLKIGLFEKKILKTYSKSSCSYKKTDFLPQIYENCVLHGSCVIFTKKWIENESFVFLPLTFLYGEEFLLADYARNKGYETGICPFAQVLHLGGKSTLLDFNDKQKQIFKTKMTIKAFLLIIKQRFIC